MKNFLKIFVFLEILLFAYIFNSSIYNIYEKNNIAADNLSGYMLEEPSPEILNQYDRKECLDRINRAEGLLEAFGKFPQGLWQEILNIYIVNQRSY